MPVLLRTTKTINLGDVFNRWVTVTGNLPMLPAEKRVENLTLLIENAFGRIITDWWMIGCHLAGTKSASLAHTPACIPYASDFGLMLSWMRLTEDWALDHETTLVICDDPWLFRQLSAINGVNASTPPSIWLRRLRLLTRGFCSRTKAAISMAAAAIALARTRRGWDFATACFLVYGHPRSTADGFDGYFGDLFKRMPNTARILHVDCCLKRSRELTENDRTFSLHAWGSPFYALTLPFCRWQPTQRDIDGPYSWLIRRAEALEGSSGQGAMIAWQIHCQNRWLDKAKPTVVVWPWENHSWERGLVRRSRQCASRTIGYQHSVVGQQMINHAPASNADGLDSLPDRIMCCGTITQKQLAAFRVPESLLVVGGALRFPQQGGVAYASTAPVFLALPFAHSVAAEMLDAARLASKRGFRFVVKDHPMTPFEFHESDKISRTEKALGDHETISTVVYASTTVGLEGVLLGIPTLRFLPSNQHTVDILPKGINVPQTCIKTLADDLVSPETPPPLDREQVFAQVAYDLWERELEFRDEK